MPEMEELGIDFPVDKIRKRQKIYISIALALTFINIECLVLFSADIFSKGYNVFFTAPFDPSISELVIANCLLVEITFVWIIPLCYMTAILIS